MGLNKIPYLLLILLFLISCDNSPNQASDNPEITTGFSLLDSTGANTTTFRTGADIHFKYSLTNETGETQNYFIPDTGPFVSFEILRTGVPLGSSEDGFNYAPSISEDSLAKDESIARDYNWYSSPSHQILTEGDYKARATPRLQFNDTVTPASEEIDFTITANANFQLGDSTDLVIITGQSPASLQLDAFTLNSMAVSGDTVTLNLSYSGGCLEHDFSLFMSPGRFSRVPAGAGQSLPLARWQK